MDRYWRSVLPVMSADERMNREQRLEEVSVEEWKRWVTASVRDAHGLSDEPQLVVSG